jgi:hypothetical protein
MAGVSAIPVMGAAAAWTAEVREGPCSRTGRALPRPGREEPSVVSTRPMEEVGEECLEPSAEAGREEGWFTGVVTETRMVWPRA